MTRRCAFTLIELLIVVAIIAILAAIAVPNFLEAQTRSKVSRTKVDMRSLATGLEAYLVDNNHYPVPRGIYVIPPVYKFWIGYAVELTTPVAYMTTVHLMDVFNPPGREESIEHYDGTYENFNFELGWGAAMKAQSPDCMDRPTRGFYLCSWGPDYVRGVGIYGGSHGPHLVLWPGDGDTPLGVSYVDPIYDPTNGTRSGGDIMYFGGELPVPRLHGLVGG